MANTFKFKSLQSKSIAGGVGTFTTLSANNGTVTASAPVLDLSQTWNNSGVTFTGMRFNATDTASAAASVLADFQVGGTSFLSVRKDGVVRFRTGNLNITAFQIGNVTVGTAGGGGELNVNTNFSASSLLINGGVLSLRVPNGQSPVFLARDDGDIFAQRNGLNPQTFRIYGQLTGSDVSATGNYERGYMRWSAAGGVFQIGTEKGNGGGLARALELQADGTTRIFVGSASAPSVVVTDAGGTTANAGGTLFVKSASTTGWPTLVLQRNSTASGAEASIGFGATTSDNSTFTHQIACRRNTSLADSDFVFTINSAERLRLKSDGLLQFQGTTNAFPALKRSSTALQVRLADDTAFAPLEASTLTGSTRIIGPIGSNVGTSTNTAITIGANNIGWNTESGQPAFYKDGQLVHYVSNTGNEFFVVSSGGLRVNTQAVITYGTSTTLRYDDTAGALAQRSGNTAQTFRLYTTIGGTGNADFERLFIRGQTGGAFQIGTEKGGTGGARDLTFLHDGTTRLTINDKIRTGSTSLVLGSASRVEWGAGTIYLEASTAASPAYFKIVTGSTDRLNFDASGIIGFGGLTSLFPALKRSSTALQVRLADDTAFAPLEASNMTATGDVIANRIQATVKNFYIKHPTKPDKHLVYSSLETPYNGVQLTGEAELVHGECIVQLPDYLHGLIHANNVHIQLTNYKHSKVLYVDSIDIQHNRFTVKCNSWASKFKTLKFFWLLNGVRKDIELLQTEV